MVQRDQHKQDILPLNDFDQEKKDHEVNIKHLADEKLNEEKDDVKLMNKMVHYSKCVTIRDKQLQEAKALEVVYSLTPSE
jgi:hypothetical protein